MSNLALANGNEWQIEGEDLTAFNELVSGGMSPHEAATSLGYVKDEPPKAIAKSKGGKVAKPKTEPVGDRGPDSGTLSSVRSSGRKAGKAQVEAIATEYQAGVAEGVAQAWEEASQGIAGFHSGVSDGLVAALRFDAGDDS